MSLSQPFHLKLSNIHHDINATVDLPMRLVVALVIGTITLVSIFTFISQSLIIPAYVHVSVEPLFYQWNETENSSEFIFTVKDSIHHHPITKALVVLKGPLDIYYKYTNQSGKCIIQVNRSIPDGIHEWFLDVSIKASGYEPYNQDQMIRMVDNSTK